MREPGLPIEVSHEPLEFADMDGLSLLAEHAAPLALPFMTADAAADGGKIAARVDYLHGIAEIAFRQFADPVGNIVGYRAALAATRHLAVETALSLADSLRKCVV